MADRWRNGIRGKERVSYRVWHGTAWIKIGIENKCGSSWTEEWSILCTQRRDLENPHRLAQVCLQRSSHLVHDEPKTRTKLPNGRKRFASVCNKVYWYIVGCKLDSHKTWQGIRERRKGTINLQVTFVGLDPNYQRSACCIHCITFIALLDLKLVHQPNQPTTE